MRSREAWKAVERWWAEQLGGVRVPVTGRGRGSAPDVEHSIYSVEVKAGKVMSSRLRDGMVQAVASSGTSGRLPLLCVSHSVRGRASEHYVIVRLEDWQAWNGGGEA